MVILLVFLNHESFYDVDPKMKRYKLLQLERKQNLSKMQRAKDSKEFRANYIANEIQEQQAMDTVLLELDGMKVSGDIVKHSISKSNFENNANIQLFQPQTTDILTCNLGDILFLIDDCSSLFDPEKRFGIHDAWLFDGSTMLTLTNISSDVPDFIALSPEEITLSLRDSIHVKNYQISKDVDQQDFAWKIYRGNYLVWLRPSLNDKGILMVIAFESNAILAKREFDLKTPATFDSINNLHKDLKLQLWDLFKLLKNSGPDKTPIPKWAIE
jgi:hypothetical protein